MIFPLKDDCYLTTYMLGEFFDDYLGVRDPDGSANFDAEAFDTEWQAAVNQGDQAKLTALREQLEKYITSMQRDTDEIVVPTGQLFIEALPGSHALLEDFKLLHRAEDVRKVKAEVRHTELENLRLASRLDQSTAHPELLGDPDVERTTVVRPPVGVEVDGG